MRVIERDNEKIAHCEALMKECADLHLAAPTLLTYGIDHFDKEGNQILKETAKSNSFVRNYYNYLAQTAIFLSTSGFTGFGPGIVTFKDLAGSVKKTNSSGYAIVWEYDSFSSIARSAYDGGTSSNTGIVVGSSDVSESFESYKLGSIIPSSGGFTYSPAVGPSVYFDNNTNKLTSTFARSFVNTTGAAIEIKEIGYHIVLREWNYSFNMLIVRDVLLTPLVLAHGESAVVSYAFSYIMSN